MWPGAEMNVDAGRRNDAVKHGKARIHRLVRVPDAAFAELCTETDRTTTRPSLMRPPFDRPVYR